jgi:hypothetical protein
VSATLRADLTCPGPEPALTLAAGVNLNLGGHTLSGPGSGLGIAVPVVGDVTVRNGTLTGWGVGIQTAGTDDAGASGTVTVQNVTFDGNSNGIDASGDLGSGRYGKSHVVTRSEFTHNSRGILASWWTNVAVSRSHLADNGTAVAVDSSNLAIADSVVERNTSGITLIEASVSAQRTKFYDNGRALVVGFMSGATVADSLFKRSTVAVDGAGYGSSFAATGSTFADNTTAVSFDQTLGALSGNTFRANGTGFVSYTPSESGGTVLQDNVFRLNGDGIRIDLGDGTTSLGGNTANANTGWGIYAPGVVDLGGNTARGNGNSPQCVGVVCPTRAS